VNVSKRNKSSFYLTLFKDGINFLFISIDNTDLFYNVYENIFERKCRIPFEFVNLVIERVKKVKNYMFFMLYLHPLKEVILNYSSSLFKRMTPIIPLFDILLF